MPRRLLPALVVLTLAVPSVVRAVDERRAVAFWTEQLHAKDPLAREAAARGLALAGFASKDSIPDIIEALGDPVREVRLAACDALADLHRQAGTAARPLASVLATDLDPDVRIAATKALVQLGEASHQAVPDLLRTLTSPDEDARTAAAQVLGRTGEGERGVVTALETSMIRDSSRRTREAAHDSLDRLGVKPAALAVPLIKALDDPDPGVRRVAAAWLDEQPSTAGPAVAKLAHLATTDPDASVRKAAVGALASMGPDAGGAVPVLLGELKVDDPQRRAAAARLIGRIGSGSRTEVDPLAQVMVSDAQLSVRQAARSAIVKLGRRQDGVVLILADQLTADDERLGEAAAETLGVLDKDAAASVPALTKAATEGAERVRNASVAALGDVGAPAESALPVLAQAQHDRSDRVRVGARKAIDAIHRDIKRAQSR